MVGRVCLDSEGAAPAQYAPPSQVAGVCGGPDPEAKSTIETRG